MTDLLPFLRLYRQHWLSLSLGLLLALVTLVAGMGLLSLSGWFLSAAAVAGLARAADLDMPISTVVAGLVDGRLAVAEAMQALLSRPLKQE